MFKKEKKERKKAVVDKILIDFFATPYMSAMFWIAVTGHAVCFCNLLPSQQTTYITSFACIITANATLSLILPCNIIIGQLLPFFYT